MEGSALALLPDVAQLSRMVEILQGQVASLQAEVRQLRQENIDLRMRANSYKALHRRAKKKIDRLEQEVRELKAKNRQLRQEAFGPKRESLESECNSLKELKELEAQGLKAQGDQTKPRRRGQQPDRPGPKRRSYEHLPEHIEVIELPADRRCCLSCGLAYQERPETEDSQQLEIQVKAYRRTIKRRRYQPQCRCQGPGQGPWRIVTAPPPAKLISKSRLGTSIWVEVLLEKFLGQRPLHRVLAQWRLNGLQLAPGTVTEGLKRLLPLFEPFYQAIGDRLQQADYWQSDDTRWQVFAEQEGKKSHRWWLWVFLNSQVVLYVLDARKSRHVPEAYLPKDCDQQAEPGQAEPGVLVVDRARSYKAMAQVKDKQIVLAFCWAHVRRDFIRLVKSWPKLRSWAIAWLLRIRKLYQRHSRWRLTQIAAADTAVADTAVADTAEAQKQVQEQIEHMHQQAVSELADSTLARPCQKVLESLLKHWPGLTRFVSDRRIPLDNNASERQLRSAVVGRKNYYGTGSLWSGQLAAILFSLFATLERWQVNVRQWLSGYLDACALSGGRPPPDWSNWLPWRDTLGRPNLTAEPRA
jgi:transposase